MTGIIRVSDKVSDELFRIMELFFDIAALSAEDIIMINDMIVETGIEVWVNTYNAVLDTKEQCRRAYP